MNKFCGKQTTILKTRHTENRYHNVTQQKVLYQNSEKKHGVIKKH